MKALTVVLVSLAAVLPVVPAPVDAPVLKVVKPSTAGASLLRNGDFESTKDGRLEHWHAAPKGFRFAPGQGRGNSGALACESPSGDGWFGASQTLTLNRTSTAPLVVRGWSRAENVSGGTDNDYSLYVDLIYADGTPLWGQTGNFRCGTHDWERREFTILPEKPVRSLTLHCLFRGHAGKVWFDDVSVEELKADGGTVLFQNVPVAIHRSSTKPVQAAPVTAATRDGLALAMHEGEVTDLKVGGNARSSDAPSGFLLRDVAANSDFVHLGTGDCPPLAAKCSARYVAGDRHIAVEGRLSDTSGKDRALTLVFALPLDATGWHWGDDIHRSRVIQGDGELMNPVGIRCGATGTMSQYPVAAVWNEQVGVALALDMAQPAVYRVGYHAGLKLLFIAYDFGLVRETQRFPGSADFRFILYRFEPQWGFRAAWQKYMEIFPEAFAVRAKQQGLWMPFTDISKVEGWQDFGFKFHEGNNNVPWDDAQGILSFRYTEPMTWWMRMKKGVPRTYAEALRARDDLAAGNNEHLRTMAQVSKVAAMQDEAGQPSLLFRNEPWCDGVVWSLNPNPFLGADASESRTPTNAATVHWNEVIKEALYGAKARGRLDGEYLDSLEGYVTAELNYRRAHFRDTTVPLTFSTDTRQPALFKGLAVFEFTRWISEDVHRLGGLMFANGVPYRFAHLCPWLDVLGTETDWLSGGKYRPASVPQMDLWRTLSGAKPYVLLMNTDYDAFTPALVEKYFQRCLFYGMWPGFFSHNASENPYFQNPKWYNRDRALFRKYVPLLKRVSEAGWRPVTDAMCDNPRVLVERFGPDADGTLYFTLYNDTSVFQEGWLRLPLAASGAAPKTGRELVSGSSVSWTPAGWKVSLESHQVNLIQLPRQRLQ